jgi:hypothetical protein
VLATDKTAKPASRTWTAPLPKPAAASEPDVLSYRGAAA